MRNLTLTTSVCLLVALCLAAGTRVKARQDVDGQTPAEVNNAAVVLDLKNFGAVGDGVTDDGPALQRALDALAAAGGGTLNVPAGRYAIVTPAAKSFAGLGASVTIAGVPSSTQVAPPDASATMLAHGLDLQTEFLPRTGSAGDALLLVGLRSAVVKDIAFVGTPGVNTDARTTLVFDGVDDAAVTHCEFYGLSSSTYGSDLLAIRSRLRLERSVFLGCTANSGSYTSVVTNLEWKGFRAEEVIFLDYGLRPELFSKTGLAAPISWVQLGNAAPLTNDSPRREAVFRSVFMDEGGLSGIASLPDRYPQPPTAPIDLVYVTGLKMNVTNLVGSGNYLTRLRGVLVEDSAYGWSLHADSAINLITVGNAILDRVKTEAAATRIRADATTSRLTVIDSVYTDLASLAQQTFVINTTQPGEDPVQYVRGRFTSALGRAPDAAAHFYWSDKILRCGTDAACAASARTALDAYLAASPHETFQITGRVAAENDSPLAGVAVTLSGSQSVSTTTDAAGLYHFSNLPTSGVYTVGVSKRYYTFATPSKTFTTPAADARADFAAVVQRNSVSGRVTDDTGHALAGATVSLTGSQAATATSDANGGYSFAGLSAGGNYTVKAEKVGYTFAPVSQGFTDLSADARADFTGTPTVRAVFGRVVNANNSGLAGIPVTLSGTRSATTTTAADGSYLFAGLPVGGSYTVKPSLLGYVFSPTSQSFNNLTADQYAGFVVDYIERTVKGRVTLPGGAGVSGVTITVAGSKAGTTATDSNGNYSFSVPNGGDYTVTFSKAHYVITPPTVTFNNLVTDKTVDLAATLLRHSVSGRVTKPDGSALAGVAVALTGSQTGTTTSDANGNYSFANLAGGGDYTVTPTFQHYAFVPASKEFRDLGSDQSASFVGTLDVFAISGRVTKSDSSPFAGVTVSLAGAKTATATTDANGSYSFTGLGGGGSYTVTAASANYAFAPPSRTFDNLSANQSADFAGTLVNYRIGGRVTEGASPLAGVTIALTGSKIATATTAADGSYSFTVPAEGNYAVTPSKALYAFAPQVQTFDNLSGDKTADFAATLLRHTLSGRVTKPDGSALAGATLSLTGSQTGTTTSDAQGNYSFTGLGGGGSYTVTAASANYTFAPPSRTFNDLSSNQTADFVGTLAGYHISGRVTENGSGLGGVTLALTGSQTATATTAPDGSYSFAVAAGGDYTVTASKALYAFAPPAQTFNNLGGDKTADFSAALLRFAIRGRVTDANHAGLQGVSVALTGSQVSTATTAADGSYAFPNLVANGTYTVTPTLTNYAFAPPSKAFEALDADKTADFDAAHKQVVEFVASSLSVGEGGGTLEVTVTRTGDTSEEASAVYEVENGTAVGGSDLVGSAGRVTFAPGETTKTFTIFITDDTYVEGAESFSVRLTPEGAAVAGERSTVAVTINDNDTDPTAANAIDDAEFFVRQHYVDFLGREPDAPGLAFWKEQITSCGADMACRDVKRINVSAAFFLSIEYQETSFFVYKTYRAAYGRTPERLGEFALDAHDVGAGVVVGVTGWERTLETNKESYLADFISRAEFEETYPVSLTPAQFVSALDANAGNSLTPAEKDAAAAEFGGAQNTSNLAARARVLRSVVDNAAFSRRETNPAFVLTEYFGYMRREPDQVGFDFWLKKLEDFGGDYRGAEMVKAFIASDEYRHRFGR